MAIAIIPPMIRRNPWMTSIHIIASMPPKYVRIITAIPILMINQVILIPPEKATMAMASRYSMVPILEKCSNTNAIEL